MDHAVSPTGQLTLGELARYVRFAARGDHVAVAAQLLKRLAPPTSSDMRGIVTRLLKAVHMEEHHVDRFEAGGVNVLVRGRFGYAWLSPLSEEGALLPPGPRFSPRGIKQLALGLTEHLTR